MDFPLKFVFEANPWIAVWVHSIATGLFPWKGSLNFAVRVQHLFLQRGKTRHWELLQLTSSPSVNSTSLQLHKPSTFSKWKNTKPHQFSPPILPRGARCVLPEYHWSSGSQLLYKFYKFKAEKSKSSTQLCACGRRWRNPRWVEDLCLGRTMWIPELLTCCKLSNGGQRSTP